MYERGCFRGRGRPGRGGQGGGFPRFSRGAGGGPRFVNRPPPPGHFQGGPPGCPPWGFPGMRPGMPSPGFSPRDGPRPGFCPRDRPRLVFCPGDGPPTHRTGDGIHHPFNHRETNKRKHFPGQQDNITQKKKKVDKRELPENNRFYCEVCDRGFKTKEKYQEHTDGHEQCRVEGCSYAAAPKLVKLHYEWQHRTGLAKKIWKLESKEDIEKWRNARRRNFPTQENIAKKKERMEAMITRGEVLETQHFGKMKGKRKRHFMRGRGGRGWRSQHNDSDKDCMNLRQISREQGEEAPQVKKSRDPSLDPLAYVLDDSKQGSDDEARTDTVVSGQLSLAGGLGSLAAAYADSSDEEESTKPVPADGKLPPRPEIERAEKETSREDKNRCNHRHRKKNKPFSNNKKHLTLLQKLLAPEVRHERNVILQCIRHIINKDFFDSESTNKEILKAEIATLPTTGPMSHVVDDEIWENGL